MIDQTLLGAFRKFRIDSNYQITKRMVNSLTTAGCFHDLPISKIIFGGSDFFNPRSHCFLETSMALIHMRPGKFHPKKNVKKNPLKHQAIQKFIQAICSLTRPRNSKEWIRSSIAVRCPASENRLIQWVHQLWCK